MPILFHEIDIKSGLKNRRKLSSFLEKVVVANRKDISKININYLFCNDEFLVQMNRQYLQHDTLTDILTFDLSETPGLLLIAEIYISIERVKENAEKFETAYNNELLRVIFHGVLHLCGFKDKTKIDKENMRVHEDLCIEDYKKELF